MKLGTARILLLSLLALSQPLYGQLRPDPSPEARLPNGKSQSEAILKAEHEKSLKDAAELMELAEELKEELEKNDRHVVSVSSLKKTEQIEKLAKRIRSRLKRY
ncbi:MAG: hypothetical protein ACRD7E_11000 [Bryobacteraceae bacterium]